METFIQSITHIAVSRSSCEVCGGSKRIYPVQRLMKCCICLRVFQADQACEKGHYVCAHCHGKGAVNRIESWIYENSETNPLRMLDEMFALPYLKHEDSIYHCLVPAILVRAYQNSTKKYQPSMIREVIERCRTLISDDCTFPKQCAIYRGLKIVSEYINETMPDHQVIGEVNVQCPDAVLQWSTDVNGCCCMQNAFLAVKGFIQDYPFFNQGELENIWCKHHRNNFKCLQTACSYYPIQYHGKGQIEGSQCNGFNVCALDEVLFRFKEVVRYQASFRDQGHLFIEVETENALAFTLIHCNLAHRIWQYLSGHKHEVKILQLIGKISTPKDNG